MDFPLLTKTAKQLILEMYEKGSRLDIVIGPPVSGKSSVLADVISQEFHSNVLDNDEAKKTFREFNKENIQ